MPLRAAQINVGDRHEAVVVDGLTRTQIVQYAGASGDYNPLHTDEVYATPPRRIPGRVRPGLRVTVPNTVPNSSRGSEQIRTSLNSKVLLRRQF